MRITHLLIIFICAFLTLTAPAQTQTPHTDTWTIRADTIDPPHYAGVTVANGMIGLVSSAEPFKAKDVVLNGAFDLYGRGRVSNILKTFNFVNLYLDIDGQRIDHISQLTHVQQTLDMRHAALTTHFDYGDKATISYTWYSLRHLPYTALVDVTITAKKDMEITPASVMEAPDMLKDVENYYNEIDRPHVRISLLTSTAKSPTGRLLMAASNSFLFDEPHGQEPSVIHEMWDNSMHLEKFKKQLKAGATYHFSVVGSAITSAHSDDPLNEAERLTIFAALQGSRRLIAFHQRAWDELWKSDILIDGDDTTQRDIHLMLYHLYSFAREGTSYSLSPMGLSGLGYNGHTFWDTELWMFPALLLLQPRIAASLVEYRYQRLETARHNAASHGYKGAMFPWESAASGNEETPVWALSGPFEHHITADVAIAAWNYYCVTQDKTWLREKGYPILKETADFWASRVERNGPGHYDILNVVAADEWAENVDNNAFTNAAARANLQYATDAAKLLDITPNPDWMTVRNNIPILRFEDGTTKEHASYNGEKIKQADVNLLAYPLKEVTTPSAIRKDLEYYLPRVGEGPAMTHAIFSILYSRLGSPEKAYKTLKEGYTSNLRPPFGVMAETATGNNPYFATGAGGILQALLNGFGGLEITPAGITQLKTGLPARWHSLRLTGIGPGKKDYMIK
ncbi:glycoside hydrolase family 65 protein [Flavitalea sp. BT771]|uniref:glycosyl hydrolase family 95 catalytic domain-containing protein n=1 Tax=Flavitalea sp. BT771 TaxID=3063329 RepID=UPI0026E486D4|nr:glycoside hydrolase family 65 protein [Flavitalea sp. BT771]MDO6432046.1 glycoside hydrolase family 65 protein [Flavitalea sp. BT771]MDV6220955.1 glycoside hydrolase family 65 protein [Flavitalea sp. BT771]